MKSIVTLTKFEPFNGTFSEVGYKTTNFFIELGVLFFVILLFPMTLLLRRLLKWLLRNRGENCFTKWLRKEYNHRNVTVRFLIEGCIELGLVTMICITRVSEIEKFIQSYSQLNVYF